jgi:ABC-type transporter Mla subunit MlaD
MEATKNRKLGAVAVAVVALVGVGAAVAASKLHGGSRTTNVTAAGGAVGRPADGYGFRGAGRSFGFGGALGGLSAAASYLGVSRQQLFTDLRSGKTLAQIADSTSGKSASGLIDAMVAQQKSTIDAAAEAGRISQALADRIEANTRSRITATVNGEFGPGAGGRGFGPPGGSFGQPPTESQSPQSGATT